MVTLSSQGAHYRTKLMERQRAEQFAKCLEANPLFTSVTVEESRRSPGRYLVSFQPANAERRVDMLVREQRSREARARAEGAGYVFCLDTDAGRPFFWCVSTSGEVYETTVESCSCPDHHYRLRGTGLSCKHQLALSAGLGEMRSF
jgi:hypothetical protein